MNQSRSPFFFLAAGLIVFSCARLSTLPPEKGYKPESLYKKWFFETPAGMAVGYPGQAGDLHLDGKIRLSGYVQARVKGFQRQFSEGKGFDEQDSVLFYYNSLDTGIFNAARAVDSFRVNKFPIYLMALDPVPFDSGVQKLYERATPPWICELPGDPRRIFAIGREKFAYYDQASSWMKAEETAIKNLCQNSAIHFAAGQKFYQENGQTRFSETSRLSMDLRVRNIRVLERFYDPSNKTCHVLVTCLKTDIGPFRQQGEPE